MITSRLPIKRSDRRRRRVLVRLLREAPISLDQCGGCRKRDGPRPGSGQDPAHAAVRTLPRRSRWFRADRSPARLGTGRGSSDVPGRGRQRWQWTVQARRIPFRRWRLSTRGQHRLFPRHGPREGVPATEHASPDADSGHTAGRPRSGTQHRCLRQEPFRQRFAHEGLRDASPVDCPARRQHRALPARPKGSTAGDRLCARPDPDRQRDYQGQAGHRRWGYPARVPLVQSQRANLFLRPCQGA